MDSIERSMVRAYHRGRGAVAAGIPVTDNPFNPASETAVERVQSIMWVRGYGSENPVNPEVDLEE